MKKLIDGQTLPYSEFLKKFKEIVGISYESWQKRPKISSLNLMEVYLKLSLIEQNANNLETILLTSKNNSQCQKNH